MSEQKFRKSTGGGGSLPGGVASVLQRLNAEEGSLDSTKIQL